MSGTRPFRPAQPAPPPAPAAPQPAYNPQALPLDPAFDLQVGTIQASLANQLGGIEYQRGRTRQEYGFEDVSNPYNRAAMLQRSYQQGQTGNLNQMAARGQLYSGALQRQQEEGTFQYGRSKDALRRQYEDVLQGLKQQELGAWTGAFGQYGEAMGGRLERAAAQPPEDPGVPQQQLTGTGGAPMAQLGRAGGVVRKPRIRRLRYRRR